MPERPITTYDSCPPNIPKELWMTLTDPVAMNPLIPEDISKLGIPIGFDEDTWKELVPSGYEHKFLKEYPHPPVVWSVKCSGNDELGSPNGHSVQLILVSQEWLPSGESGREFGIWKENEEIPLTRWIPSNQALEVLTFGGNPVPVLESDTDSACDNCFKSFREATQK